MLVYLAGPVRPKGNQTLEGNIQKAKEIALELWKKGFVVICPHANSDLPITLAEKEVEADVWLDGDLVILSKCDIMIVIPNWELSDGTKNEIQFAKARNIPVYYYPDIPKLENKQLRIPKDKLTALAALLLGTSLYAITVSHQAGITGFREDEITVQLAIIGIVECLECASWTKASDLRFHSNGTLLGCRECLSAREFDG